MISNNTRFFLTILYILIPALAIVASVNILIDPANIYKNSNYEKGIAEILTKGNHVTNITNYNERLLQKKLIETGQFKPEILILGSSRIMEIGTDFFKGAKLMNNGVSMAVIEDDLAILNMYIKQGIKPNKIILGLDPWTLNDNNPENRWKFVYQSEYNEMLDRIGDEKNDKLKDYFTFNPRYSEMFSFTYFQESLKAKIWNEKKSQGAYYPTQTKTNNTFTKLTDGSISYDITYRSKTPEELKNQVVNYSESVFSSSLLNFNEVSSSKMKIIDQLILYCKKNEIEIELLLAPFHPYSYNLVVSKPKYCLIPETEIIYKNIANHHTIKLFGSFNPANLNFKDSVFFDEMHCNEWAMKKILNLNE